MERIQNSCQAVRGIHKLRAALYTCGPRLSSELTGAAGTTIQSQQWGGDLATPPSDHHCGARLAGKWGTICASTSGLPQTAKRGVNDILCVRHREEYDKMCQAIGRMLQERGLKDIKWLERGRE